MQLNTLQPYTFHINLYELAFLGMIFTGLNFALLLGFTKRISLPANRFLALALVVMVLWMVRISGIDIRLPLQFSLALGPLIFFYVLKLTRPEYKFSPKDLLHFVPALLEQAILLNPVLQFLALISMITYLYYSHRLIERYYQRLKFNGGDRYRYELRWLHRLLLGFGLLWLLWIPFKAVDYFYYHNQLGVHAYYPLYLLLAVMTIWIGAGAFLRGEAGVLFETPPFLKPPLPAEMKQQGVWLKRAVQTGRYYQDPELSLSSLAEKLDIPPHELSRIINAALKKNFNDFINEYRVADVVQKMQDPAYDHITLLGIAFESGFNAQSSFSRIFKQMTGKRPLEYKNDLKKEFPNYNLRSHQQFAPVVLHRETAIGWSREKLTRNYMIRNYLKIAWRNLIKNRMHSSINIAGLAVGMAVAMLIGLWIWDELSFNQSFNNYNRIAIVMQHQTANGDVSTGTAVPYLMGDELKKSYGNDFKYVSMSKWTNDHILAFGENKITKRGNYFEPPITEMLSLKMLKGTRSALQDNHSIILSASTAKALFGNSDPMNKRVIIDNKFDVTVTGIYEDLPFNSDFNDLTFIAPWKLYIDANNWAEKATNPWGNNSFQTWVQMADNADMDKVSAKIKDVWLKRVTSADAAYKPVIFLRPMRKWHLYSEFKNGVNVGGRIQFVWLFGMIGFLVLLLACINFMNLSTARSEKRAKEVGIRKAIGSLRGQLIRQFFCESVMVSVFAFICSIVLVVLMLPFFNEVADKKMQVLWYNPLFWLLGVCFSLITGIVAGSYPALYLSSFQPVKVLKGTFRAGRFASLPRKILVVLQFTVSAILIIGTIVVFRQIQYAKNRPVGYNRNGLVSTPIVTEKVHKNFAAIRDELKSSGEVSEIAETSSATTYVDDFDGGFSWRGKDPSVQGNFGAIFISPEFGKTVGWHIKEGRDFSRDFITDSTAMILNETAVKFTGLKNPVGETIKWNGKNYHVIGVINDMLMQSPYDPVFRSVFVWDGNTQPVVQVRINPAKNTHEALAKIEAVFKKYNPAQPFTYGFADADYARKFGEEERIGKLANFFTILAIFISCLGLYGMASFMAEQRTKEIGVRKVLGATVFGLWGLLSKDFIKLVVISLLIAIPIAFYFMHGWLQNYNYRTGLSWWIFASTAAGAIIITLLSVSYQSIKAAIANPVKSLRNE